MSAVCKDQCWWMEVRGREHSNQLSVAATHGGNPRQRHVAASISIQHSDARPVGRQHSNLWTLQAMKVPMWTPTGQEGFCNMPVQPAGMLSLCRPASK